MTQPPGFIDMSNPDFVCRLRKSLHGLKQSPHMWHMRLTNALLAFGFHSSKADVSLYSLRRGAVTFFCLIYVDDLMILSNDAMLLADLVK